MARSKKQEEVVEGSSFDALKGAREGYVKTKIGTGKEAKSAIDNGDNVAETLREMHLEEVYSHVAKTLGVTAKSLKERYGHLNAGQQRMNLGNRLRGFLRKEAA
ncbi:hypothetical protein [Zhongshania sp.]|uniref:hypothetical protein n=1 Tax=Zhongshania sp. TaxID=1971902 RepID=UPI003561A3A3